MGEREGERPKTNQTGVHLIDWKHLHLWQIQPVRDVLLIAAVFGLLWLGYKISIVTVPLMLALLLAYLLEPIVHWLTKSDRMSRSAAAGGLIAAAILVVVVPLGIGLAWSAVSAVSFAQDASRNAILLQRAIEAEKGVRSAEADFSKGAHSDSAIEGAKSESTPGASKGGVESDGPQYDAVGAAKAKRDDAYERLPNRTWRAAADHLAELSSATAAEDGVVSPTELALTGAVNEIFDWVSSNSGDVARVAAKRAIGILTATIRTVTTIGLIAFEIFLTAFFFFFICSSYRKVLDFGQRLIPMVKRERTTHLLRRFDEVIAGFVRGRLTIALIQCVVFSMGYFLIGTPAALLVGFAVGILSIVPYLALVGIPLSMLLMALDPADGLRGTWWWILTAPVGWYFIGQAIDDYVLTPKIQGEKTGLDTPTVLFAVLAGGALAGFYGLLIAIPVAACVKIVIQEVVWPRFNAWIAGRAQDPLPLGKVEEE